MSSAGVGPLCFLKTNVTEPVYQETLEHFMLPSAEQLFKDADFIFQQDLAPVHTAKSTKSWLNDQCAWLTSKLTRPEHRESMSIVKKKMKKQETKTCRWAEGHCQRNLGFTPPQQCHKLITSMPRRIEAVIKAKGAPAKNWVHIQYMNILSRRPQFTKNVFVLVLWSIIICWEWIGGFLLNVSQNHHN